MRRSSKVNQHIQVSLKDTRNELPFLVWIENHVFLANKQLNLDFIIVKAFGLFIMKEIMYWYDFHKSCIL